MLSPPSLPLSPGGIAPSFPSSFPYLWAAPMNGAVGPRGLSPFQPSGVWSRAAAAACLAVTASGPRSETCLVSTSVGVRCASRCFPPAPLAPAEITAANGAVLSLCKPQTGRAFVYRLSAFLPDSFLPSSCHFLVLNFPRPPALFFFFFLLFLLDSGVFFPARRRPDLQVLICRRCQSDPNRSPPPSKSSPPLLPSPTSFADFVSFSQTDERKERKEKKEKQSRRLALLKCK